MAHPEKSAFGDGRTGPLPPIPLTVITGFLGAGKTTLLNRLLKHQALANTVVIVNEFGEIGLDHLMIEQPQDGMIVLASGCLCCTVRGDLIATLENLLRRRDNGRIAAFDRVVIETTGLADPAPILQVTMNHRYLAMRYRLEGVVTVVDGVNGRQTLEAHREAAKQVAVADRIVLSKADLCLDRQSQSDLAVVRAEIRQLNPTAPVLDANGSLDVHELLDCGIYNPATKKTDVARWLHDEAQDEHGHDGHDHGDHHQHAGDVNRHSADIRAFSFTSDQPVSETALNRFLDLLRLAKGPQLLRLKGVLIMEQESERPLVVHCVQHVLHPVFRLPHWPDANHTTRLVGILQGADDAFINRLWSSLRPA